MIFKCEVHNQTSKYAGVTWNKNNKCWQAQLQHNNKKYHGGNFDKEEHAAMNINLLCDKLGLKRKNPMVDIKFDEIRRVTHPFLQNIHFPLFYFFLILLNFMRKQNLLKCIDLKQKTSTKITPK